jgi:putative ABC transport system permease protein
MSTLSRSMRNVFGKKARTIVVVVIIGFSLGVFLSMSIVSANIQNSVGTLSEQMERTVTVRAAGSWGFMGGENMPESVTSLIQGVDNIDSVQRVLTERMETDSEPSPWGGRSFGIAVQGMDPGQSMTTLNGGTYTIEEGRALNADDNASRVAIIGTRYSEDNGIYVGDAISLNGTMFQVVGVITSGTRMGDNTIIAPYTAVKAAFGATGPNVVYVVAKSVGVLDTLVEDLRAALGDSYDVVTPTQRGTEIQDAMDTIKGNSQASAYIALLTGIAVMVFIMILITRERFREIGVMKAIGFKNSKIMKQLLTESLTLAVIGFVVGVIIAAIAGPSISNMMVDSTTTTPSGSGFSGFRGGSSGSGGFRPNFGGRVLSPLEVNFSLEPSLLALTLLMAVVLGVVGSLYPLMKALKLKPAEALRYD